MPMYELPTEEVAPERAPRSRTVFAMLMAVVLFGSGVGIGWLVSSGPDPTAPAVQPVATAPTTTTTTTATSATTTPPAAPTLGAEPVADIAEIILPSIVQLELPTGVGSGVIYDPSGLVLTAAHVVEGGGAVTVLLSDGSRFDGEVLGADALNDIAVVRIETDRELPAATLALGHELRVGQLAVAVGSPWELDSTVTSGIVSAVSRPITSVDGGVLNMVQTDAAINPGNSGGALVDRQGRVIGINVSIFTETGVNEGVGFAVPIDRAFRVATALEEGGTFVPGFLGVEGDDAGVGEDPGAVIRVIQPGSAADQAGLRTGDRVVAVDGQPVSGLGELAGLVRGYEAGDTVVLDVVRDGDPLEIEVRLGSR
jgi:S1-C subfamily serine protease